ncbi:MAG TPA: histidine kinase N-terminal 7TM domain-containing protein [Myxococcota bacterium]|nr:histidine kinase N-terminal 7TM domain-containing protein [Myxococcota bacterium]
MHPYLLVPLLSCVVSAAFASSILARDPSHPANRKAALLIGGSAFWALCEVLWNATASPATALFLVRLSALGFVALGPLCLHLFLDMAAAPAPHLRRAMPALYAIACLFLLVAWTTPWIHPGVVRTGWGYGYELGPAYPFFYVFTISGVGAAFLVGWRELLGSASEGERRQARAVMLAMVGCLLVASVSDGLLPFLGVQLPRFGTAALASLGAVIAWGLHRFGYSLLAPGTFAREILQMLPAGVALLRLDGRVRTANAGLGGLVGCESERLLGESLLDRLSVPAERLFDGPAELECSLLREDGERIPVSVSSTLLRDKEGSGLGRVVVLRDLREVVALRRRLVVSARLAAVGELAAGVAHEINNPLTYVRTNLGLLRGHWMTVASALHKTGHGDALAEVEEEVEQVFAETLEGVDRAASFVRDVKGFSASSSLPRDLVDVNELLESAMRVITPSLRERVRVTCTNDHVPFVLGAPAELKQVFLSMLLAAGNALGNASVLRLRTAVDDGFVAVSVSADGEGLSAAVLEGLLRPAGHEAQDDASGLSIACQLAREHDGELDLVADPIRGALLRARLPLPPRDRFEPTGDVSPSGGQSVV